MALRTPSASSSTATPLDESGKLHSPSAARNAAHLCNAIQSIAPAKGRALEIASGTGQHVVAFAQAMPNLTWLPTDHDASRLGSISAHSRDSGLPNILPPMVLDAADPQWAQNVKGNDLIVLANLLHLISEPESDLFLKHAAQALNKQGRLLIYGPFKRAGALTSEGDIAFDTELRDHDPEIGYKDDAWVIAQAKKHLLTHIKTIDMPANNLALVFQKK